MNSIYLASGLSLLSAVEEYFVAGFVIRAVTSLECPQTGKNHLLSSPLKRQQKMKHLTKLFYVANIFHYIYIL